MACSFRECGIGVAWHRVGLRGIDMQNLIVSRVQKACDYEIIVELKIDTVQKLPSQTRHCC